MRRAIFALPLLILTAAGALIGQSDAARDKAISEMRRIAEAIKECPEEVQDQTKNAVAYWGPPLNVEWDVVPSKTVRSPFQGFVEFSLQHRSIESEASKRSKELHDQYMQLEIYGAAYGFANSHYHLRYEFDLGTDAPTLTRMLWFNDKTQKFENVDTMTRSCWETSARTGAQGQDAISPTPTQSTTAPELRAVSPTADSEREDGHRWESQSKEFKLGFLTGYISATNIAMSEVDPQGQKYPGFHFGNYTLRKLYDGLDTFYSDPANRQIRVQGAITWVKGKIEGTSQEDLQKNLEFLRNEESQ